MMLLILILVVTIILYLERTKVFLHHHSSALHLYILKRCPEIRKNRFHFTPYLFTGLLQAYFASKQHDHDPKLGFKRIYVDHGVEFGYQALDWGFYEGVVDEENADAPKGLPIVLVLSGLTASRAEPYIVKLFKEAARNPKWRIVLVNDRLYNNRVYLDPKRCALPSNGYMNYVEDFRRMVEHIHSSYPDSSLYAVGHSFGSNTLVRYLGMCGANNVDSPIKGAVSVCNPFDFQHGIKFLEDGVADGYIKFQRQKVLRWKIDQFKPAPKIIGDLDYNKIFAANTSSGFDHEFTRKLFCAPTVDYHFLSVGCVNMLLDVKVPVFFLGARDDPVINYLVTPNEELRTNPNFLLLDTAIGGHISWFKGILRPQRWYVQPVMQYLEAIIEYQQ